MQVKEILVLHQELLDLPKLHLFLGVFRWPLLVTPATSFHAASHLLRQR